MADAASLDSAEPAAAPAPRPDARFAAILNGPILPTLAKLTTPVLLVIAAQLFVSILEAYWVSRLGTEAVAGVALVLPLFVLMGTMSNGGIGGGVAAAVARAKGAGNQAQANALLWHAILIAVGFGLLFTIGAELAGPALYAALGGRDATLTNALDFSFWVFGGATIVWLVNLIGAALRGAGEVKLPALINLAGAAVLVPLSPLLIFGWGPVPALGVAGAGVATLIFYAGALAALLLWLRRGTGPVALAPRPIDGSLFAAILRVGLVSAVGTLLASLTIVAITGSVGQYGAQPLAGYGLASRVDSLLVPLLFGLGTGVVTMVGAASGAGHHSRAWRVTWLAAGLGFAGSALIGVTLMLAPGLWMDWFTSDPAVHAAGSLWFRMVGGAYGFFGLGLMLYFAAQGFGRMQGPLVAGIVRLSITAGGAAWLAAQAAALDRVYLAAAVGMVMFGLINAAAVWRARPA
ncbi:MATE family efflux transporter [Sandarakinorhabdus sp.]|uniref:MATE family efflux transporter n=1 Tax=Sandarakinorhabdus sp. TaxID=1916663 RepID=UPI00333F3844